MKLRAFQAKNKSNSTPSNQPLAEPLTLFITWTTYGTWLPGDQRGWRKFASGPQPPQPRLANWCRERLIDDPLFLTKSQRCEVDGVIREHAAIRKWELHALSVRTNHVQLAITTMEIPETVRDQLKANATTRLRRLNPPVDREKVWTRGGDVLLIADENALEAVVEYILVAQDRMDRGK